MLLVLQEKTFASHISFDPDHPTGAVPYYWPLYRKYHESGIGFHINLACLIFGPLLFLYRRMYMAFAIIMIVRIILTIYLVKLVHDPAMADNWAAYLMNFASAFVFDGLYFRFLDRKNRPIGTHVRLIEPLAFLGAFSLGALLFQFVGFYTQNDGIVQVCSYAFYGSFLYVVLLYVVYFGSWVKQRLC